MGGPSNTHSVAFASLFGNWILGHQFAILNLSHENFDVIEKSLKTSFDYGQKLFF